MKRRKQSNNTRRPDSTSIETAQPVGAGAERFGTRLITRSTLESEKLGRVRTGDFNCSTFACALSGRTTIMITSFPEYDINFTYTCPVTSEVITGPTINLTISQIGNPSTNMSKLAASIALMQSVELFKGRDNINNNEIVIIEDLRYKLYFTQQLYTRHSQIQNRKAEIARKTTEFLELFDRIDVIGTAISVRTSQLLEIIRIMNGNLSLTNHILAEVLFLTPINVLRQYVENRILRLPITSYLTNSTKRELGILQESSSAGIYRAFGIDPVPRESSDNNLFKPYWDSVQTVKEKVVEEELPVNEQEEMIINTSELCDFLTEKQLQKKYPDYTIEKYSSEYEAEYNNTMLDIKKYKRNKND